MAIQRLLIILLLPVVTLGALGDQELAIDGAKLIWNNNSQTFSIAASGSMSASVNYIWPVADATSGGQALLSNSSGVLSWGVPTTATAHNILSGTHDATTNAVTRGSIIYGNSTPKWDELVIGANQLVFVSDGTDPSWGTVDISGGTNLAVNTDHFKLTGDTLDLADNQATNLHFWQGSFLEQFDFTISEAGGVVTGSLEKENTGDLIMFFSDEYTTLDCTPAATVTLTSLVGTDTAPAAAFVYVPQSTKTLTAAASWPSEATEHIRVASIVLQSAATTGTNGVLMNRNWNDESFGIDDPRGQSLHTAERLRFEHALHNTGVVLSITGSGTGTVTLDTTSGTVYQLHLQTFPVIDMAGADDIHLVNLSGSEYSTTSNLVAGITTLADGSTPLGNNKYFNIVIWGVQNRSGTTSHLMCNLPTGQYTKSADATVDSSKFSVHTIPSAFRGTGFLIAELTFRLTGGGSTWTTVQNKDLLGQTPTLTPGGGTTTNITTFSDSQFEVFDNANDAKRGDFELSGVTTGNTRTLTWPDVSTKMWADDGSVPLTANWDVGAFDIRAATITPDGLTSGRVVFASTNGLLVDDADMTFSTDTLTVTKFNATDEDNALQIDGTTIIKTGLAAEENLLIGDNAGANLDSSGGGTDATQNVYIGKNTGKGAAGSIARRNVLIGQDSGRSVTSARDNIGIGFASLLDLTTGINNAGIGFQALTDLTTGKQNFCVGTNAGFAIKTGDSNTAIGQSTLFGCRNDSNGNVAIGAFAQQGANSGFQARNVSIGGEAAQLLQIGSDNVCIGNQAGESLTNASSNVFLGARAGWKQTTSSNLFIIDNQDRGSAAAELTDSLIYGVFSGTPASQTLRFNVGTTTWHNATHEDTDGGRENIFNFKGQQSGGEETTLARIEISHDGAADDQKGKIVISTNDGTDSDTPTTAVTIDSSQGITFAGKLAGAWDMDSKALTNVNIDSGVITGITDLAIGDGGTGQGTAQAAIDALSAVSGATNEHVLTKDTASGNAVWKASAGATKWNAIGDADGVGSIDFVTFTQTIDIGVTDTGGSKSGLILDVTGLGAGTTDVIALEITTVTDDDSDYVPIAIYDDSGAANDLLFYIDYLGGVHIEHDLSLGDGATIGQGSGVNSITFTDNGDIFNILFDGTDINLTFATQTLNLRNAINGVDAIVEIEGNNAGEKGILRVMSDGDDKYIELYHDDTDVQIVSSSGDIQFTADGIVYNPSGTQAITGVGDTLLANSAVIVLNPDADYTMTSAPTIANGSTGQILYIICANAEANTVTVQDQDTLGASNLHLGAATRAISGKDVLTLLFDGTTWIEVSYADN